MQAIAAAGRAARAARQKPLLRLMAPHSLATGWLVPVLGQFGATAPAFDVDPVIGRSAADFERQGADLAIRAVPIAPPQRPGRVLVDLDATPMAPPSWAASHVSANRRAGGPRRAPRGSQRAGRDVAVLGQSRGLSRGHRPCRAHLRDFDTHARGECRGAGHHPRCRAARQSLLAPRATQLGNADPCNDGVALRAVVEPPLVDSAVVTRTLPAASSL